MYLLINVLIFFFLSIDYQIDYSSVEVLQLEKVHHNLGRAVAIGRGVFAHPSDKSQHDHKPFSNDNRPIQMLRTRQIVLQQRALVLGSTRNHD